MSLIKRKICFVLTSKIHYARSKLILQELRDRDDVDLQIVVGASAILKQYGDVETWLKDDGFTVDSRITITVEGGNNVAMAKTAGLGVIEFASVFENLDPDVVVVRGDRYEVLSAAIAAVYMNKTLAHIEGGDVSGTVDESVRHAITKLAHIHFATNDEAVGRIKEMGENPDYVFNVGSPDVEFAAINNVEITSEEINKIGVGNRHFNVDERFLMVMQHPVTSEVGNNRFNMEQTLRAIMDLRIPTIWFWPNIDAGSDESSNAIRRYRENTDINDFVHFVKYLPPEKFLALLKKCSCLIGNSSAGIKECSYLGVPVVNIGTRQAGRARAENVFDVNYDGEQIKRAIEEQLLAGRYKPSNLYYKENSSKLIADKLINTDLYVQKRFFGLNQQSGTTVGEAEVKIPISNESDNSKNVLCVITARGGSKGIPRKNVKPLGGKPLIAYSIDSASKSQYITHSVVSTDDEEIAFIAREYGGHVPFMRPEELARDDTPTLPVLKHAALFMEEKLNIKFDYIVIFQPTSPFRTIDDIDETIKKAIEKNADSAVTIVEVAKGYNPVKIKRLDGDRVLPYHDDNYDERNEYVRQDFSKAYKRSSAVYVMRRDLIVEQDKLYGDYVVGHLVPEERSIDIDDEFDWLKAEYMLQKLRDKGYDF